MKITNNAVLLKRQLLIKLAQLELKGLLEEEVDRIPLVMTEEGQDTMRCCKYRDRAIFKYRLMADLGLSIEDEEDELVPLKEYARKTIDRKEPEKRILTVVTEACSSCKGGYYHVSGVCRGCVARPCKMNCPVGAITIINGQSTIDQDKCIKCGKCLSSCPYSAIIRVPVPCEEACPVGAISKDASGREEIDFDKCIFCGKCIKACPFGAIMEKSQIIDVVRVLKSGKQVVAIPAPSIAGQFPGSMNQINQGLRELGFSRVVEAGLGADLVAKEEAMELAENLKEGRALMTTSCCPAYVRAAHIHIPEIVPYISHTPSPMIKTGQHVRGMDNPIQELGLEKNDFKEASSGNNSPQEDIITVFIGPCIAKRSEANLSSEIDWVLSFEELGALFVAAGIDVAECKELTFEEPSSGFGVGFAVSGGVTQSVLNQGTDLAGLKAGKIDGLDKKAINLLKLHAKGKLKNNFLEIMACEGGCVNGPGVVCDSKISATAVKKIVDNL